MAETLAAFEKLARRVRVWRSFDKPM